MPSWVFDPGMITCPVVGPIMWNAKSGMWLDIFASPEAGSAVDPAKVGLWTAWDPIKPAQLDEDEDDA
jgi:hypothetical protein